MPVIATRCSSQHRASRSGGYLQLKHKTQEHMTRATKSRERQQQLPMHDTASRQRLDKLTVIFPRAAVTKSEDTFQ
jgi:hypothetical protein